MADQRDRRSALTSLTRATQLYARSVYAELRKGGYSHDDVARFVGELMDLLTSEIGASGLAVEAPPLIDPEGGLPDRSTTLEVLGFEVRHAQPDRREGDLYIMTIEVQLPHWASSAARQEAHELFSRRLIAQLRSGDCLGRLERDRYLLVLPRARRGVVAAIEQRIAEIVEHHGDPNLLVVGRSLLVGSDDGDLDAVVARCLEQVPTEHRSDARPARPSVRSRPTREPARVVLALGGGAARAASHAGVLEALAARETEVVGIAGCSAGALVAAMVARGLGCDEIVSRFLSFTDTPVYRGIRRAYAEFLRDSRKASRRRRDEFFRDSNLGFYSEVRLQAASQDLLDGFIEHFVGSDCEIASLRLPITIVATDLVDERPIALGRGSLHAALAASCAVPGLFPPQRVNDRLFIDGTPVSEVPIVAAKQMNLDAPILAVHLGRPVKRVSEYRSSAELMTRMNALIHAELVREQLADAEHLVTVDMADVGWLDFRHAGAAARRGFDASMPILQTLLGAADLGPSD